MCGVPFPGEFTHVSAPWWDDAPCLIVGTGPSLRGFDLNRLRGLGHVLAVNAAVRDLPFAEAFFTLDLPHMVREHAEIELLTSKMEVYLALPEHCDEAHYPPLVNGARYLRRYRVGVRVMEKTDCIESGGHSGFGAFNLAFLKRAKHIFLFGFDYQNADHYCPQYYEHQPATLNIDYYPNWARNFNGVAKQMEALGVAVTNASLNSRLTAFPRVTLDTAIEQLRANNAVCATS